MNSLFISTHLDDAVFSCGKLISVIENPTVLTVFGGVPDAENIVTAYDQKSGFSSAKEAVEARNSENQTALALLGAKNITLDFVENQYDQTNNYADLVKELNKHIQEYDEIYIPLGLLHPDHLTVAQACKEARQDKPTWVYMDMPYYVDDPIAAGKALSQLEPNHYEYRGGDLGKKMQAVSCYASQVKITNLFHLMCDERYYKIEEA